MPDRLINESIRTSDQINDLSWFEECFFFRLITAVDDFGRYDARPQVLKAALFPLKDDLTTKTVSAALETLATMGLVGLYEVDGKPYLYLPTWAQHQRIRNKRSKYPSPPERAKLDSNLRTIDSNSPQNAARIQSNPIRIQSESNPNPITPSAPPVSELPDDIVISDIPFNTFWELYPRKEGKRFAQAAFATAMIAEKPEVIIAGLKKVIELRWSKMPPEEQRYIPKAEKWLNGMCWQDDVQPYTPKRGKRVDKLPEYYDANPVRKESEELASPEEVAAMRELLKRGRGRA